MDVQLIVQFTVYFRLVLVYSVLTLLTIERIVVQYFVDFIGLRLLSFFRNLQDCEVQDALEQAAGCSSIHNE